MLKPFKSTYFYFTFKTTTCKTDHQHHVHLNQQIQVSYLNLFM